MPKYYDAKGRQIYPGDLLKSLHFIGARGKRHYLYHTAVMKDGRLWMVPTSHLEPAKVGGGGACMMDYIQCCECEIIAGHGPGNILSFEDRPRLKLVTA